MTIDPWIFAFSSATVIATIWMGFWSARRSKTAHDFYVAGRSVSVGWNASAISGEYLSAASLMGVAGMVMSSGYDALWYPVCYACGYLFLLLFVAGPLRRFGAYTIPDFAEGRYDSPLFRKIAVVFVLFIGFFYTMPQMKGAGTTLAYIFPGLPYGAGVVLVGAVITLNVALGGMKGITLVQAFQYWAKMFAISVPIFVLMAVYGNYGKQLYLQQSALPDSVPTTVGQSLTENALGWLEVQRKPAPSSTNAPFLRLALARTVNWFKELTGSGNVPIPNPPKFVDFIGNIEPCSLWSGSRYLVAKELVSTNIAVRWTAFCFGANRNANSLKAWIRANEEAMSTNGIVSFVRVEGGSQTGETNNSYFRLDGWEARVTNRVVFIRNETGVVKVVPSDRLITYQTAGLLSPAFRKPLPEKAPADSTWLSPFGPLTTKAAKAAAAPSINNPPASPRLKPGVKVDFVTVFQGPSELNRVKGQVKEVWHQQVTKDWGTGAASAFGSDTNSVHRALYAYAQDRWCTVLRAADLPDAIIRVPTNIYPQGKFGEMIEQVLATNGVLFLHEENKLVKAVPAGIVENTIKTTVLSADQIRPYALLYTYSLIIALVCGTAGLPHILVRFYTNPDGVAAKRTTMWVMILIGIFYVFPPVFGVMGRNLLPELYAGVGAKGTDKIVLELPRILNERYAPLGSILSGITCAGAFAAFMSTFSGSLVSMTGALAHDVYGRMFKPKSTPEQRLRAFKVCTVLIGGIAIVLGCFVEPLEINFMVGQAFAIAAASYFPLLFMSVWWRGMTMRGAATGMLTGGLCALAAVTLTNFSNLALDKGTMGRVFASFAPLNQFWAGHPLLRILCEQPAIWTVPLAIGLMIVIGKLTSRDVPPDTRMKMLVLHAPEKLGLKQEYIQERQHGH